MTENASTPGTGGLRPATGALYRCETHGMLAGVAAGLAEHFELDANLVRLVFVLLTLSGGLGALLYAAGWALIPEEGAPASIAEEALGRRRAA